MPIGLVSDSPSDLPANLVELHQIQIVPAILVLEGQSYLDGVEISRERFYDRLPNLRTTPTTAAPPLAVFQAAFQKLLDTGCDQVLGIFTAEKLTSIANNARSAARDFGGRVTILESGSLSMGTGLQVLAAAEAIQHGLQMPEVLQEVAAARHKLRVYAGLDTMEYLRRSGRVPGAVASLGGLLHIKPVVELREGDVRPLSAVRTTRQATLKLFDLFEGLGPLRQLCILHSNVEARALEFLQKIRTAHAEGLPKEIAVVNVTTVIGTHVGPNAIGLAAVQR